MEVRLRPTAIRARTPRVPSSSRAPTPRRASPLTLEPLAHRPIPLLTERRPAPPSPRLPLRGKALEQTFAFPSARHHQPRATRPRPERRSIRRPQPVAIPRHSRRHRVDIQLRRHQPDDVRARRAVDPAEDRVLRNVLELDHVRPTARSSRRGSVRSRISSRSQGHQDEQPAPTRRAGRRHGRRAVILRLDVRRRRPVAGFSHQASRRSPFAARRSRLTRLPSTRPPVHPLTASPSRSTRRPPCGARCTRSRSRP